MNEADSIRYWRSRAEQLEAEVERLTPKAPEGCTPFPPSCWINNDGWIMRQDGLWIGVLHGGWRERVTEVLIREGASA